MSDGRERSDVSSHVSTRQKESLLLISITYLAASLYWIGTLLLIFYIALSCRLISNLEAENMTVLLQSPSTLYMMILVTVLALVKDNMFARVNTPKALNYAPTYRRKPQKPTVWGLSCTLFIILSLITLHSKGALTKIVDAASSTDFLTTTDIVYSTVGSILHEMMQEELTPSNFRNVIHSVDYNRKGTLRKQEYIAFCGNRDNIFHPSRQGKSTPLYLTYNQKSELAVYDGQLTFRKLSFPLKYLYVIITALFPVEIEPKHAQLIWSSAAQSHSTKFRYKFDIGDVLRIEKQLVADVSEKKPYKLIFSDSRFSVAYNCKEPQPSFVWSLGHKH